MQITDKGEKNVFVHDLNRVFLSIFSLGWPLSSGCFFRVEWGFQNCKSGNLHSHFDDLQITYSFARVKQIHEINKFVIHLCLILFFPLLEESIKQTVNIALN